MKRMQTVQQIEQNKEKDFEFIQNILGNEQLLKWVSVNGAEGLQEEIKIPFQEQIKITKHSLALMDKDNVKMLVSNAFFRGKPIARFSLDRLMEIHKILGKDADLLIVKEDNPCIIQKRDKDGYNNIVILAPKITDTEDDDIEEFEE